MSTLREAAEALLHLIRVPRDISPLLTPDVDGTYNQRILALELALSAPPERGEEWRAGVEAAAKEHEKWQTFWPPLKDGCLCAGCGMWMPWRHPESHDHEAGCQYAFGDAEERQSPFNRPNITEKIRSLSPPEVDP